MKHNTLKRIASIVIAAALVLSLAVPAFATEEIDERTTALNGLDYDIVVQAPTISVEMSDFGGVVLNPYMLAYEDPVTGEMTDDTNTASVASAVNIITNYSLTPVDVDVTVTGSIPEGSDATFANSSAAGTQNAKDVYLQFLLQGTEDPGEDFANIGDIQWPSSWTPKGTWTSKASVKATDNKAKAIVVTDGEVTEGDTAAAPYYIMAANEVDGEDETPAYAAFKLVGDMATKSTEAWTETDGVGVSVAFTFTMVNPTTLGA